jgi:hypothetical protein
MLLLDPGILTVTDPDESELIRQTRGQLVVANRQAGPAPPIDGVCARLDDGRTAVGRSANSNQRCRSQSFGFWPESQRPLVGPAPPERAAAVGCQAFAEPCLRQRTAAGEVRVVVSGPSTTWGLTRRAEGWRFAMIPSESALSKRR